MKPIKDNWHRDFINLPLILEATKKAYSSGGANLKSK
jgi:hypothetical protein